MVSDLHMKFQTWSLSFQYHDSAMLFSFTGKQTHELKDS